MENMNYMISTKDLLYIEDIFNWNFTTAKEIYNYSNCIKNQEIKDFFNSLYEKHKNICQNLIDYLKGGYNE